MNSFKELNQQEIITAIKNSCSYNAVLQNLNCHTNGSNIKKLKSFILNHSIDISHFKSKISKKEYEQNPKICKTCGTIIPYKQRENDFCNQSCAAVKTNTQRKRFNKCLFCGKKIPFNNKYCNNRCQNEYRYQTNIEKWKNGEISGSEQSGYSSFVKRYLKEKYNNSCQICGWNKTHPITGLTPLQVHHIDGDDTNNKEDNLQLLCPNCHSLTDNYGRLNNNKRK